MVEIIGPCRGCGEPVDSANDFMCEECLHEAYAENMHSDHGHDEAVADGYEWPQGCKLCVKGA